jgi:hypothetical protein
MVHSSLMDAWFPPVFGAMIQQTRLQVTNPPKWSINRMADLAPLGTATNAGGDE